MRPKWQKHWNAIAWEVITWCKAHWRIMWRSWVTLVAAGWNNWHSLWANYNIHSVFLTFYCRPELVLPWLSPLDQSLTNPVALWYSRPALTRDSTKSIRESDCYCIVTSFLLFFIFLENAKKCKIGRLYCQLFPEKLHNDATGTVADSYPKMC